MSEAADIPEPDVRLAVPRPIELPARQPFPLLASLAPVVGSLVIWAVTSSPFALVFAFLGPVIAVAGMADSRLQSRRTLRRERLRLSTDTAHFSANIELEHAREREALRRVAPGAIALLDAPVRDPERWRGTLLEPVLVTLGSGDGRSRIRLDGNTETTDHDLERAIASASVLTEAPVTVDARLGIGVCGPPSTAVAVARGLLIQLADRLPPDAVEWRVTGKESEWIEQLPHPSSSADGPGDTVKIVGKQGLITVAVARSASELPHDCRVVLTVTAGATATISAHPSPMFRAEVRPEFVSSEQAEIIAQLLVRAAAGRRTNLPSALPTLVSLADLLPRAGIGLDSMSTDGMSPGLTARFLVDHEGPIDLDLVRAGPHAVVAGMTGSGKSELLVSWLLAIAARHGPDEVTFLLVDFKGGSAFAPIERLPQVVGLVTDLDERSAHRALVSLRAEVRHRERTIANAGVRSIDELANSALPRLVIVVDEFAALVGGFGELHELFADLAARGRSLGIHLILCTQRPAGVVRDSVLANVPLRLSLRVNNRADSIAVVGSDAAALLPVDPRGRAVLAMGGDESRVAQVAIARGRDTDAVARSFSGYPAPRRPWCPALPTTLSVAELAGFGRAVLPSQTGEGAQRADRSAFVPQFEFGVADLPEQQRQQVATWNPARDGNLLVLGATASGKSGLLRMLDQPGALLVPPGVEAAWDAVTAAVEAARRGERLHSLLLIDDLDAIVARLGDDHELAFVDMLIEVLRAGGASGLAVCCTARRVTGRLQPIANACDARLLLRLVDKQEHVMAGGDSGLFAADAPPGRGEWAGAAVQVAQRPFETANAVPSATTEFDPRRWSTTIVVSGQPARSAARLSEHCAVEYLQHGGPGDGLEVRGPDDPLVVVGDVDAWHGQWQRLMHLRSLAPMLFERCTVGDFRALTGVRQAPPPLADAGTTGWLLEPDGTVSRVRLPT